MCQTIDKIEVVQTWKSEKGKFHYLRDVKGKVKIKERNNGFQNQPNKQIQNNQKQSKVQKSTKATKQAKERVC